MWVAINKIYRRDSHARFCCLARHAQLGTNYIALGPLPSLSFPRQETAYSWLALSRNKKKNNLKIIQWNRRLTKKTALQALSLCVFLNFKDLTKHFGTNLQSPVWSRRHGVPSWDTNMENGV